MRNSSQVTCVREGCGCPRHGQSRFCLPHKREARAKRRANRMANLTFAWDIHACGGQAQATPGITASVRVSGAGFVANATANGTECEFPCATRDGAISYADAMLKRAFAWEWARIDASLPRTMPALPSKAERKANAKAPKARAKAPAQVAAQVATRGFAICK